MLDIYNSETCQLKNLQLHVYTRSNIQASANMVYTIYACVHKRKSNLIVFMIKVFF